MKAQDVFRSNGQMSLWLISEYLKDMTDKELLSRPAPSANHTAWQLGHIISANNNMLESLKAGSAPELPEGFMNSYTKDKSSVDDPASFHKKDEYLRLLGAQYEAAAELASQFSEAELDKPGPEKFQKLAPTIGALINIINNHLLLHYGQITIVRRQLGRSAIF